MPDSPHGRPPVDEELLRQATWHLARAMSAHTPPVDDTLRRTWVAVRRRRLMRVGLTAVVAAAVMAAVAVPLALSGSSIRQPLVPAGRPSQGATVTVPSPVSSPPSSSVATTSPASVPPSSSVPTTAVPAGTATSTYDPFTAAGVVDPSLVVTTTSPGNCVSSGVAGAGSYRCFTSHGSVFDPCFAAAGATGGTLVCPSLPTSIDVAEITVSSLPAPSVSSTALWAMQLADGQVCKKVNAAWGALGPFQCLPTGGRLADCHPPTAASPWWSAPCQKALNDTSPFTAQRVDKLWY